MPALKSKGRTTKVAVRDLGTGAAKGLGKDSLKKVRGGMLIAGAKRRNPPCEHAGEKCGTLVVSPMAKSSLLTVIVKGS